MRVGTRENIDNGQTKRENQLKYHPQKMLKCHPRKKLEKDFVEETMQKLEMTTMPQEKSESQHF